MKTFEIEIETCINGTLRSIKFTREAVSASEALKLSLDMRPVGSDPISRVSCFEVKEPKPL